MTRMVYCHCDGSHSNGHARNQVIQERRK